jgi:hypothetical protein
VTEAHRALRTRDLLALGVTPDELRGPRWRAAFHGVHTPTTPQTDAPHQRILDAAEIVPPGGAVGGWSAGYLLGATELDGRGRSGRERQDVVVVVPPRCHPAPRDGVRFVRSRLDDGDVLEVDGVTVTHPVRTSFDVARSSTVESGVVGTDILARQLGVETLDVVAYADRHRRFRGVPVARVVLGLTDPRSRSSGESRLRYLWVVEAGLPRPQCNAYVVDALGTVVAMADLLDDSGLVGEYDGSSHRAIDEHTRDNCREEDLEGLGLVVVRATSLDVGPYRRRTVARILDGHRRALAVTARSWGWRPSQVLSPVPTAEW